MTDLQPMPDNAQIPFPGTDAAINMGCICPVIDNHHGRGVPTADGPVFWFTVGCPVHHPEDPSELYRDAAAQQKEPTP